MEDASELSARLALHAEEVCRRYLSNGRREGRYWIVGDVRNTPGRSCFVRIRGPARGAAAAGRWTDAATGEHGDLIDLIGAACALRGFAAAAREARSFLGGELRPAPGLAELASRYDAVAAARRLFAASRPVRGTLAEAYLRGRAITAPLPSSVLRFHPACWYRDASDPTASHAGPALIAAVTDLAGEITGVHRTWLDPAGGKARLASPRRALGRISGNGVRFGRGRQILAVAEGLETALSARSIWPSLSVVAALSATHMSRLALPSTLTRLHIIADNDAVGRLHADELRSRVSTLSIEAEVLNARGADLNEDLQLHGLAHARSCTPLR